MYKHQKRKAMSQSMEIALIVGVVIAIVGVVAFSVT
jgi:flagellar basal body-associated protein FliL